MAKYTRKQIDETCKTINYFGWIAHHYPRKKQVSINGMQSLPINEAMEKMLGMIRDYKGKQL